MALPLGVSPESPFERAQLSLSVNKTAPADNREKPSPTAEKLTRLFSWLKELSEQHRYRSLRSLVQKCSESGVAHLLTIKKLDLSCCKLQELPEELSVLESLEYLQLIKNQLQSIPASLCALKKLRKIEIEENNLQTLPAAICQIAREKLANKEFFQLYLHNNPIKTLPLDIKPVIISLPHERVLFSAQDP